MADVQHSTLSGDDLHEPKGVESAPDGSVYVANGGGSGSWQDKNSDNLLFNTYTLQSKITDIGTASDKCYFFIPVESSIESFSCVVHTALVTSDAVLSVYINGVLFADTLTVTQAGSAAGSDFTRTVTTSNSIPASSVVEVRSDGGPSNAVASEVSITLSAI